MTALADVDAFKNLSKCACGHAFHPWNRDGVHTFAVFKNLTAKIKEKRKRRR